MKKMILASSFSLFALISLGQAGTGGGILPAGTPMSGISSQNMFQDRRNLYFFDDQYMIEGRRVFGTPFLYRDWEKGVITTADGRMFNGYKVRYDAFHQTVFFSNGTDSLEVNEEIKEFSITAIYTDTVTTSRFLNANLYGKPKKPMYYELIAEGSAGQLLKFNRKYVTELSKGLPAYEGKKVFELEQTFYYYNKSTKKLTQLKATGANVIEALGVDANSEAASTIKGTNFAVDAEVVEFFKKYLATAN